MQRILRVYTESRKGKIREQSTYAAPCLMRKQREQNF